MLLHVAGKRPAPIVFQASDSLARRRKRPDRIGRNNIRTNRSYEHDQYQKSTPAGHNRRGNWHAGAHDRARLAKPHASRSGYGSVTQRMPHGRSASVRAGTPGLWTARAMQGLTHAQPLSTPTSAAIASESLRTSLRAAARCPRYLSDARERGIETDKCSLKRIRRFRASVACPRCGGSTQPQSGTAGSA